MTGTMVPVERAEVAASGIAEVTTLVNQLYVDHTARYRRVDPVPADPGARAATAGPLSTSLIRWKGFDYAAECSPTSQFVATVCLQGHGAATAGREQVQFGPGDAFMPPPGRPHQADMRQCVWGMVRVPRVIAGQLAEEHTGLAAADLRFEAMSPVSAAAAASWSRLVAFVYRQLASPGITGISPVMVQEMTRLVAGAMLDTFPNTAMTAAAHGPGRVPPAAVRRAAAFIDAAAGQPVTIADIAAEAGVTPRALQYAFRRHYGTTPLGYLRRARLEGAHRELQAADPTTGATVAAIAQAWGWVKASQFTAAYKRQYGQSPSHTLRT